MRNFDLECPFPDCGAAIKLELKNEEIVDEETWEDDCPGCGRELSFTSVVLPGGAVILEVLPAG